MAEVAAVTDLDLLGALERAELPDFDRPDRRTRTARRYARAMLIDSPATPIDWDPIYAELRQTFTESEIVELGRVAAIAIGGIMGPGGLEPRETEERWT
jgi:alkylhydroperoxidase family enzyme